MTVPFPEPTAPAASRAEVFTRYLDYFRDRLAAKLRGLPERELRRSRLLSGWTPLELLKHLTFVEMRWLEWGFEGREVADPWGDRRDGRWYVAPDETLDDLLAALDAQAERSAKIIAEHDLSETGKPGDRWDGEPPATLERILFHLLQEYARHLGHLDIVSELADGPTGELPPADRSRRSTAAAPRMRDHGGLLDERRRVIACSPCPGCPRWYSRRSTRPTTRTATR